MSLLIRPIVKRCNTRVLVSLFQLYRELRTETPWTLSLHIPDRTYSCTPVPATRGYGTALYHFSMNHRQRSLQTETGPNVTQFLQVSITLHCFLGAPSVLSHTGSEGGEQCHKKRWEGSWRGGGPNTCVKDYRNKTNCAFVFSGVHFSMPTATLTPEHNS